MLAEPQSILGDVVVTLPATFAAEVAVTLADGKPAKAPRLQLLQGRAGQGAAEMHIMGLVPPIDLRERKKEVAEGRWRLENLPAGTYTLLVDAPGHATSFAGFDISAADAQLVVALTAPRVFPLQVLDAQDKPLRNAAIYAQARGRQGIDMPVLCGRTGADGKLAIDKLLADTLRVSAEHPKWGVVHGEAKVGEELTLRMQAPGTLQGVIRENGKPPELGKFTVALERRNGDGPRGPLESVPTLLSPGLDGTFAANVLQPGQYSVQVVKALDALRSPGGIFTMVQEMFVARGSLPRETVQVVPGQVATVTLEAGEKPIEGPTARLTGSLTVDGKLGAGHLVTANAKNRRFTGRVDERGRFDIGTVPAGDLSVVVMGSADSMLLGPNNMLWSMPVKLAEAEVRDLVIEVMTSSISGACYDPSGEPVAGVNVQGQGQLKGAEKGATTWINTQTNAQGEFVFDKIAEGKWTLTVRSNRGSAVRGQLAPIELVGGAPVTGVRLQLEAAIVVKGRVDMALFGEKKPEWGYISFHRLKDEDPPEANGTWAEGIGFDMRTGTFQTSDLTAGRYRLRLHTSTGEREQADYHLDTLVVPATGLSDLVLKPGARITR